MNRLTLILAVGLAAGAQEAPAPAFDVASVRAAGDGGTSISVLPSSLSMRNIRLNNCIAWAYRLQDYQVLGPGWLDEARFDIVAKGGAQAGEAELRLMLRSLLAERFKLGVHREEKIMQSLVLTVTKNGHKLKPTEVEGSPSFKTGKMNLTGNGATLGQMTEFLSKEMRQPVVDQTGLTGRFNYFLDIASYVTDEMRKSERPGGGPPPDAPSIVAQAIQSQLGLRLDAKKLPIEVLVIDRIEKSPTEN